MELDGAICRNGDARAESCRLGVRTCVLPEADISPNEALPCIILGNWGHARLRNCMATLDGQAWNQKLNNIFGIHQLELRGRTSSRFFRFYQGPSPSHFASTIP